ncbi:hypothetical protein [Gemmatimonas sp.]|jgi:hypothetical protein|uniref:hypothetical protein n=1 Tax=Gemmatimonas sp. TaxID=1962908 RepID=UPI0031C88109|nr:hypothetical protein [Gemmatimonas sp.]
MTVIPRIVRRGALVALSGFTLAGCSDFLTVTNPNVINASAIDPVTDAVTLAASAQQNFAVAHGWFAMYQSWMIGEALVAETFPTRNEYGRREVLNTNGSHASDVWQPISVALSSASAVLNLTLPTPTTNISYARAATFKGYSFVYMAESFCVGVSNGGGPLTTTQMLDSAIASFARAITVGSANATADGIQLANIARVGLARAQLQAGRTEEAIAAARAVPAGFVFNIATIDDPAQRTRLGNRLWQFTLDRGSITVAPAYRITGDPRIRFKTPAQHNLAPQDPASGAFFIQDKYPAFNTPIRLASKLEADYIEAEASGTAAQLAFIAARRSANDQPAYTGPQEAADVLTEFLDQKGRDFYLEAKRMGDFRRRPMNMRNLPIPGAPYFKAGFAPIGNQTCWPLPLQETDNNLNFPRS